MTTIENLRELGYDIGIAHGSVVAEEAALEQARAAADPALIQEQANTVVADTVTALTKLGKVPDDESERLQMFAQMGEMAFQTLTAASTERVAFHESALAIAKEMPDVWHVAGPGFSGYVSCKPDGDGWDEENQQLLDALADRDALAERAFQADNPDAMQEADEIRSLGIEITRPKPGADVWEAEGRTYTAADLAPFLAEVRKRPAPPSTAEKVAAAIAAAPEISDATKAALGAALASSP